MILTGGLIVWDQASVKQSFIGLKVRFRSVALTTRNLLKEGLLSWSEGFDLLQALLLLCFDSSNGIIEWLDWVLIWLDDIGSVWRELLECILILLVDGIQILASFREIPLNKSFHLVSWLLDIAIEFTLLNLTIFVRVEHFQDFGDHVGLLQRCCE